MSALRYLVALALVIPAVLPNTIWSGIGVIYSLEQLVANRQDGTAFIITSAFASIIWIAYSTFAIQEVQRYRLWIICSLILIYIVVQERSSTLDNDQNCAWIIFSFSIGLTTALVLGSYHSLRFLFAIGTLQAGYAIYYYMCGVDHFYSGDILRAGGTFHQPNALSSVLMCILPIASSHVFESQSRLMRTLSAFACSLISLMLLLTWSRGMIIGCVVGIGYIILHNFSNRRGLQALLMLVSVLVASIPCLERCFTHTDSESSSRSLKGRYAIWHTSAEIFHSHWLTGVGPGNIHIKTLANIHGQSVVLNFIEPKNLYLFILDGQGVCGAFLFVLLCLQLFHVLRSLQNQIFFRISACFIAILTAGLFDTVIGPANRIYSNVIGGILIGVLFLAKSTQERDEQT